VSLVDIGDARMSAENPLARAAIIRYEDAVLRYLGHWQSALEALEIEPENVLVRVLAADYYLAKGNLSEARQQLQHALRVEQAGLCPPTARERALSCAMCQWLLEGAPHAALKTLLSALTQHPADLFMLKRTQLVAFVLGDFEAMLHAARISEAACQQRPLFYGLLSFALEQNGEGDLAEAAARRALELDAEDVWAQHCLAHTLYFSGRHEEGAAFLQAHASSWDDCMSFMYTHNYFHLAIAHLALGHWDAVERIFNEHVWPLDEPLPVNDDRAFACTDRLDVQDQLGALGLLLKYELRRNKYGQQNPLASRWASVVEYVALPVRSLDPLHDVLVVHALTRLGRFDEAETAVNTTMRDYIELQQEAARRDDLTVQWLGYARGVLAAGRGDWAGAADLIARALATGGGAAMGGSNEQREVLHEFLLLALEKSGQFAQAVAYRQQHWT
jgi:tetratricopeptide (TPR) repeat protein